MSYRDTLINAKNRLYWLRSDLYGIESDLLQYRAGIREAIDAPITDALEDEASAWKVKLDKAESALTYWINDIQREIDTIPS